MAIRGARVLSNNTKTQTQYRITFVCIMSCYKLQNILLLARDKIF